MTPIRQRRGCLRKIQIESQSPFVAAGMSSGNRGIIKDSAPMYPTIGGREPGPHMPRRLKGRLEVQRELRLYHHPAPKYTLCRSKSRTLCIGMHQLVLHWVQGRCIALRNVRTLGDFSATVVLRHYCHGRTLPTASGTLQLEKSVISCSTAPQLHRSTAPQLWISFQLQSPDFFARCSIPSRARRRP